MTTVLNSRQVTDLIKDIGQEVTVLVEGEAGIGKTSIHYALAQDPAFTGYYAPKPVDCTQLSDGSVWMPDIDRSRGVSRELPNERFGVNDENHKGVKNARPALICLDEIAKARQFIKDVLAPIVYERRIGQYELPKGSVVTCFTNLTDEGLGDSLQGHLRNRIVIVQMRKPTKDEWVQDFAIPNGLRHEVIAAVEQHPMVFESFMDYRAGGMHAGRTLRKQNPYINDPSDASQGQVVTPRSLHTASKIIARAKTLDSITLQAALAGTVGEAFAAVIMSMIRFGARLPSFDHVCADPQNTPLPDNPTAQIVQVFQFCTLVQDRHQADACSTYVSRMREEMKSLFVNHISNSNTVLTKFAMSVKFGELMRENRAYLGA